MAPAHTGRLVFMLAGYLFKLTHYIERGQGSFQSFTFGDIVDEIVTI